MSVDNHDADDELTRPETLIESWSELPENTDDWQPGQRIGQFRLLRQLGRGGMGVVWLADQLEPLQRRVAIKVLQRGNRSRLARAWFEVERQSLAQLSHRAIAGIFDAGHLPDGGLFFAMEYVEGLPLNHFLEAHQLSLKQLVGLFIEICAGIQHAHQRGLIHRDLKPGNIVVRVDEAGYQPKIIDFGIAISVTGRTADQAGYNRAGTRAYMAPEQLESPEHIDVRADVYALGATLTECLLIQHGLQGAEDHFSSHALRNDLQQSLGMPAETVPETSGQSHDPGQPLSVSKLPGPLRAIAARALAVDRDQRYPSASAMAEDLSRWLQHRPVSALDGNRGYRIRCFLRRNAVASVAVALVSVALISGLGLALYGLGEAREGRSLAEAERAAAEQRRVDAERLIQFMLGDFATGLRPIGRLDLLDEIAGKAWDYLREQPVEDDVDSLLNRARALRTLGEVHVQRQQPEQASDVLAQAASLLEPWREVIEPSVSEVHFESGQIAFWRGLIGYRAHDWEDTARHWHEYLAAARRLAETTEDSARAQWELTYAYNNLGTLAEASDHPEVALEHFKRAHALRSELTEAIDATGAFGLANNLSWISRVHNTLGEVVEAWQTATDALALIHAALDEHPEDARLVQAAVNFRLNLARLGMQLELTEQAKNLLLPALELAERDVNNEPGNPRRQATLAWTSLLLARLEGSDNEQAYQNLARGRQAMQVAIELGIDDMQSLELPTIRALAELHLDPVHSAHRQAALDQLDRLLAFMEAREDFESTWMLLTDLARQLLIEVEAAGEQVGTEELARLKSILDRFPAERQRDLRFRMARAVVAEAQSEGQPMRQPRRPDEWEKISLQLAEYRQKIEKNQ